MDKISGVDAAGSGRIQKLPVCRFVQGGMDHDLRQHEEGPRQDPSMAPSYTGSGSQANRHL